MCAWSVLFITYEQNYKKHAYVYTYVCLNMRRYQITFQHEDTERNGMYMFCYFKCIRNFTCISMLLKRPGMPYRFYSIPTNRFLAIQLCHINWQFSNFPEPTYINHRAIYTALCTFQHFKFSANTWQRAVGRNRYVCSRSWSPQICYPDHFRKML